MQRSEVPSGEPLEEKTVPVWDLPTRLFHWLLVALVAVNFYTGLTGGLAEMRLHMKTGYAILALVLFRLAWGVIGSHHSRFVHFVRGPQAALAYARELFGGARLPVLGHNPLGAWSVLAMLASLLVQAATGLFANDDIFTEGPLADTVSKATSDLLSLVHSANSKLLMLLIALHLSAILFYLLAKGENLVRPMVTGRTGTTSDKAAEVPAFVNPLRALVAAVAATVLVWATVAS
jgi:cytochrome b